MKPEREGFYTEVYGIVSEIPRGKVITYGQIAMLMGRPGNSRMVGQAMANAPEGLPCHRVVNSQGRPAPGWDEQHALLEAEGVIFRKNGCVNLEKSGWRFIEIQ